MVSYRFRNKRMRLKTRAYGIPTSWKSMTNSILQKINLVDEHTNLHISVTVSQCGLNFGHLIRK